ICRVRGIGVADSDRTSTRSLSCLSSSFCFTPKRCSSSTISRPSSLGRTSRESTRWVPIRMSTLPSPNLASASFTSLVERKRDADLPLAGLREGEPGSALALGVEIDQLAGERLRRAPGAQLHLLPGAAAELGQRRVAGVGAHVATDLVQLIARHEHAVAVLVL